jgi:hypothetical protein
MWIFFSAFADKFEVADIKVESHSGLCGQQLRIYPTKILHAEI